MKTTVSPGTFSSNDAHLGGYVVYINGIEVPCKSVSERFGVWQIPEMVIEMVADPILTRLGAEDRVQVTVFYVDDIAPDPSVKPALRLFGEGEIVAWGYQNTPTGRSINFTCVNQFAIFTQLFVQFMTNLDDMIAHYSFSGAGTLEFASATSQIIYPYSLFKQGLILPTGQSAPDITRPFDFLQNVLKGMIGANVPAQQQSVPAANFFARWARLTNFVNRFAGLPVFDEGAGDKNIFPVLKALQTVSAVDVLVKSLIPQIQNAGSIYDMLSLVYQTVFMEVAMLPMMPLVTVDLKTSIVQPTNFNSHQVSGGKPAAQPNPLQPSRLQNYFAKPQFLFGLPPACNVVFPSQVKMFAYDENYATQPTRLYFNDEVIPNVMKTGQTGLGQAIQNALTLAYPPEADAVNALRKANPKTNGKNFLLFPEEFFKGPVMDRRDIPPWLFFLKQAEVAKSTTDANQNQDQAQAAQAQVFQQLKADNPDVYHQYAEYEYFRERYSRRSGSVVMAWQPYIVPGFPLAVFDDRATRVDIMAYATTVQLRMSNKGERSTQVSFTYGRTFQEMFDLLTTEFADGAPSIGTAPQEPVVDIRNVIQNFDEAETFYQGLFYGKQKLYGKDAAFDWRKVVGYTPPVPGQPATKIYIIGPNDAALQRYADAGNLITTETSVLNQYKLDFARTQVAFDAAKATVTNLSNLSVDWTKPLPALTSSHVSKTGSTVDEDTVLQAYDAAVSAQNTLQQLQAKINDLETKLAAAQAIVQDTTTLNQSKVVHNLDSSQDLVPLPGAAKYFQSYDEAMKYNWRPICTLEEYLIFYNSTGEELVPATKHPRAIGVPYYGRIRRLAPLTPDFKLPVGADGLSSATTTNTGAGQQSTPDPVSGQTSPTPATSQKVAAVRSGTNGDGTNAPGDFPQTRADWDTLLTNYRNNVYNVKAPRL